MTPVAEWLKIDNDRVLETLAAASEKLNDADGELVLDFSSVQRIDTRSLLVLQQLASAAEQKGLKLVLRAVAVDVYRVLKLAKLAPRLSFLT